ncbi:Hemolysin, contains CBS domains [Paenibacillus sp. UNCCL117]|uniref:hemolysin family protein n=1 Tax=unclassified Paenibacillus TaxID=185978 RepID=UPI000881F9B5|nr:MULTISPECIES: hemolysin family protein [unclassified Paenibacillus]SDD99315.1 Hemolysin, contains CBS domains [Paenibacillus sp. cl123]SFW55755.1 Hemolysin, contains CBS domains [Paenibacillus sp. UNCCL117]
MIVNLVLVALLIILTAFFVATEFAIIKLRSSRIDQLVMEGRKNALAVQQVTRNLDGYLSACQLGITITALGLGWLGEPTVEKMLDPLFHSMGLGSEASSILSFLIAFISITYLHVVLGELAPKSLAIQKAEQISLLVAKPIMFFYKIMYPFIWLLNGSANSLIRLFGMKPAKEHEDAHTEEEIQIILSESFQSGKINKTEYGYVSRIFAFDDLLAREIMVPRTDMACLYTNLSLEENMEIIRREQYTRFPVASESKDKIIGMINTKQFFLNYQNDENYDYRALIHPVLTVPDSIPIKSLLKKMQQQQVHIAILIDEYGGTAGLITIEDILEEIVGEIRDEFDSDEVKAIDKLDDNRYVFEGKVLLDEVNDLMGTELNNDDVDTIGGWLFKQNPELKPGSVYSYGDLSFEVLERDSHRIRRIRVTRTAGVAESESIPSTGH